MFKNRKRFMMPNVFGRQPNRRNIHENKQQPFLPKNNIPNLTGFGMPDDSFDFEFTVYGEDTEDT